ncbi:class I SAM-dependent methyltransferase [Nitrospira defluvii]|nr:class I SAM-dependent methyltransferase [Nitrospira defluvii]
MTFPDYSPVTETCGEWVTPEALSMVYTRYRFALDFCRGRRVFEVACGPGVGLGYLGRQAEAIVGGDLTEPLLRQAHRAVQGATPLVRLQAEALPLCAASRDVIVCYEALYFFADVETFLRECRRVLAPQGRLVLCTVNPEWPEFNPNSYACRYYSARQLSALLQQSGFACELFGAFPTEPASWRAALVGRLKRVAAAWRLIPSTMTGKRWLKRLFFGTLVPFPAAVVDGMAVYAQPVPIESDQPVCDYKVLFAVGRSA